MWMTSGASPPALMVASLSPSPSQGVDSPSTTMSGLAALKASMAANSASSFSGLPHPFCTDGGEQRLVLLGAPPPSVQDGGGAVVTSAADAAESAVTGGQGAADGRTSAAGHQG